eukprot:g11384.t1
MKLIVATDVAARGIDVKGVTLVVNYDAPGNTEDARPLHAAWENTAWGGEADVSHHESLVFPGLQFSGLGCVEPQILEVLNNETHTRPAVQPSSFGRTVRREDYVHRIGRTGRAGQKGYAVSLITDKDAHALRGIIEVMRRTNQEVTPEVEAMARSAGPAPPSGRALRGKGR